MFGLALRLVRDRHLAEEATQEAYLRILRSLPSLKNPERVDSWVLRVTANVVRDMFRRKKPVESLTYEPVAIEADDDWEPARRKAIDLALDELSFDERELFLLHTVEGVRLKDLARSRKQSLSAVTSAVHRVRTKVRAEARRQLVAAGVQQ